MRWSIDGLTIAIFVENNSAPLFKNNLFFLCSNFVTINEIINEILKVESDFALEVWVSIKKNKKKAKHENKKKKALKMTS